MNYQDKRVLLIAGGGTLGSYTAKELLALGARVDVICLEDYRSDNEHLTYYTQRVSVELLEQLFAAHHYDGIVNFIHYSDAEKYKEIHDLLIRNTDHLIFLSSYRVYADEQHPITEEAPRLVDVIKDDAAFLAEETYALSKTKCEDFLFSQHAGEPWTIVRPVISFSYRRFDLFVYSEEELWTEPQRQGKLRLPAYAKELHAGIDWAGNSGKMIAHLLFKEQAKGRAFTISSAQNLTWGQVAELYERCLNIEVEWCDEQRFIDAYAPVSTYKKWLYRYDRALDRLIDNSRVLEATGLTPKDFASVEDGLKLELAIREKMIEKNA